MSQGLLNEWSLEPHKIGASILFFKADVLVKKQMTIEAKNRLLYIQVFDEALAVYCHFLYEQSLIINIL